MDFLWRLKFVFQTHRKQVSLFLHDRRTTTDLTTNFLQESDKLLYGPLDLLAPEWTVVKRALCRWCNHWFSSHASLRACCRWRTPGWRFQWSLRRGSCRWCWAYVLWEDCSRPKCLTPHSRQCTGYFSLNQPTWKMKMKNRRMKRKMRETVKSADSRVRSDTQRNAWNMDDVMRNTRADKCEKMWRVRVFCSHLLTAAVFFPFHVALSAVSRSGSIPTPRPSAACPPTGGPAHCRCCTQLGKFRKLSQKNIVSLVQSTTSLAPTRQHLGYKSSSSASPCGVSCLRVHSFHWFLPTCLIRVLRILLTCTFQSSHSLRTPDPVLSGHQRVSSRARSGSVSKWPECAWSDAALGRFVWHALLDFPQFSARLLHWWFLFFHPVSLWL